MESPVTLRQARAEDMLGCARVFLRSATDLARRHSGDPPPILPRDMAFALAHLQRTDPKGFQVAEKGERVVGVRFDHSARQHALPFDVLGVAVPAEPGRWAAAADPRLLVPELPPFTDLVVVAPLH